VTTGDLGRAARVVDLAGPGSGGLGVDAVAALEAGDVLRLVDAGFGIEPAERPLFTPAIAGGSKNVGFDPVTGRVGGTTATGEELRLLGWMLSRFSQFAATLIDEVAPEYRGHIVRARTSFRPVEIAGRVTSWRKDDTRLHVDSFPASPVQGRRILRVFTNVNPVGQPRAWRIGERFETTARRFAAALRLPLSGTALALRWLRITKSRRSPYDALMLQLHDRMKADAAYQRDSPQTAIAFAPGTTWVAFTDQVSHAAMSGQYQLEQTFLLPIEAMRDRSTSPVRILERLKGRPLV
jgi:hypothetical protein